MSASRIDQTITIGQARAAPPGSPERAAFDEALAPALSAVRRIGARMRFPAHRGAARKPLRPAPAPSPRPRAASRQRRPSRPAAARKATADPEPRPPGDPLGRTENQHHADPSSRAASANGGTMPGPRHIGGILADLLPRLSREWGVS